MKLIFTFILTILISMSCSTNQRLVEGAWTGVMSPERHPEMKTPISYTVAYKEGQLNMTLLGPDNMAIPISNIQTTKEGLHFDFVEPEQQVPLSCELIGKPAVGYQGKCTDSSGKWALFTLVPPQ